MPIIQNIQARQILDSRGNPTVEVDLTLENGFFGRSSVPSGASTGTFEAIELRDNNKSYMGKSVFNVVNNVNSIIADKLVGNSFSTFRELDTALINIDGSYNKKNLGANAILGVSLAFAKALAKHKDIPLYKAFYIATNEATPVLPAPMMNIINGGSHADNNIDFQEFMIFPLGAESLSHSLQMGVEVFHTLKSLLKQKGYQTSVGDEGGFAPNLTSNEHAIEIILESISQAGYHPGKDIFIALDIAASELFIKHSSKYELKSESKLLDSDEMIKYYSKLCNQYPIVSIEDALDEEDWEGWTKLFSCLGNRIQIVGDDLTATNPERLKKAINNKAINAILIKLNQIGTITETINTINMAKQANMGVIISHRSGETEDTTIADFAVGTGVGQIKTGSLSRTDRTAKYNQLLRIEEKLQNASFGDINFLGHKIK